MGRRLWYRDSYGRWHEDRHAEGRVWHASEMGHDHVDHASRTRRHRVHDPLMRIKRTRLPYFPAGLRLSALARGMSSGANWREHEPHV